MKDESKGKSVKKITQKQTNKKRKNITYYVLAS